jgi:hypothetical protein
MLFAALDMLPEMPVKRLFVPPASDVGLAFSDLLGSCLSSFLEDVTPLPFLS